MVKTVGVPADKGPGRGGAARTRLLFLEDQHKGDELALSDVRSSV